MNSVPQDDLIIVVDHVVAVILKNVLLCGNFVVQVKDAAHLLHGPYITQY